MNCLVGTVVLNTGQMSFVKHKLAFQIPSNRSTNKSEVQGCEPVMVDLTMGSATSWGELVYNQSASSTQYISERPRAKWTYFNL